MKFLPAQILIIASALAFVGCASNGDVTKSGKVEVVRVWTDYRKADSFDRISEYFTGKENPGDQIILRTQSENRDGYYFFTRLKNPADISGARLVIDIIMPTSADPKTYTLPTPLLRKGTVLLNSGITGADWPDTTARPTAWRMRLLASDGSEVFAQQSYLWSK